MLKFRPATFSIIGYSSRGGAFVVCIIRLIFHYLTFSSPLIVTVEHLILRHLLLLRNTLPLRQLLLPLPTSSTTTTSTATNFVYKKVTSKTLQPVQLYIILLRRVTDTRARPWPTTCKTYEIATIYCSAATALKKI